MNKGFTTLEILISLVLFSLGILALAEMQILGMRGSSFNKEHTLGTTVAHKKCEDIKGTSYNSIATDTTGVSETLNGVIYTTTWQVSESGTNPYGYKTVTVTTSWGSKNTSISTIISQQ